MEHNKILLFDGVCNLCNGVVQFILKNENSKDLYFASLQSESGQRLQKQYDINTNRLDSIVYIENGKHFIKSKAIYKVSTNLKKPWSAIFYLSFIPSFIGDFLYDIVAKNRYNLFGKNESCWLPNKDLLSRFL